MARWSRERPDCRPVRHPPNEDYDLHERVTALDAAVAATDEPAVLVGHSAGCITVAAWAAEHDRPVSSALLVTPPDLDRWALPRTGPRIGMPRQRLPFPGILVASRTDELMSFARAVVCARDWGCELVDAGAVGHLNTAAGFGPWPAGETLLARLVSAAQA